MKRLTATLFSFWLTWSAFAGSATAQDTVTIPPKGEAKIEGKLTAQDARDRRFPKSPCKVYEAGFSAGGYYEIQLRSDVFDAFIRLEDMDGKELANDDDGGGGRNARLIFKAPRTGNFRIIATSYDAKGGPFEMTLRRLSDEELRRQEDVARARALEKEAGAREKTGDFDAARRARSEVIDLYTKAFGITYFATRRARLALAHNELLAGLTPEQREQIELAARLYEQGNNLTAMNKGGAAEKVHRQALAIRKQLLGEEHRDTAASYFNLGNALLHQGQLNQAEDLERRALTIRLKVLGEDDPDTAVNYEHLSFVLAGQSKFTEAEEMDRKGLGIHRKMMRDAYERYHNRGILDMLREIEFGFQERLSDSYRNRGMLAQAELERRKALAIIAPHLPENHVLIMTLLMNLGNILLDQGNYQEAYRCYERALQICRSNPNEGIFGNVAREYIQGDPRFRTAQALNNLAVAKQLLREYELAAGFSRQAIEELHKIVTNNPQFANARDSLLFNFQIVQAKGLNDSGQAEASLKINKKLLHELEPGSDKYSQVWTRNFLRGVAENLHALGDFQTAEPMLELQLISLDLNRPFDSDSRANVHLLRARNFWCQGSYPKAEEAARASAKNFEAMRSQVSYTGLERSLFAADRSPLPLLAALSARNGKPAEAWKYFEKDLGRGLLDDLSARNARPLDAAERKEEETLQGKLALTEKRLAFDKSPQSALKLRKQQADLVLQMIEFQARMEKAHGAAAGQVYDLKQIQSRLGPDSALVGWLDIPGHPRAKDPNGEHWGVVVRHQGPPLWVKLEPKRETWGEEDQRRPTTALKLLVRPPTADSPDPAEDLRALYRQRLGPLEKHLAGVQHLIVLPSTAMAGIPIEALTGRARVSYQISYAPSGTIYAWLQEKRGTALADSTDLLALGDPLFEPKKDQLVASKLPDPVAQLLRGKRLRPLPGTRGEVEAIGRLFQAHKSRVLTLLGPRANEANLERLAEKKDLARFRYLHLATHGITDDKGGMNSYLALTPEDAALGVSGRLPAGHILRTWNLKADLVTLSACQTALGERRGGEGYVGFAQALLLAGAHTLVLSQWQVSDEATTLFMHRFYQNLLGERGGRPLPKAEALAEARSWLKNLKQADVLGGLKALGVSPSPGFEAYVRDATERPLEHPYFWAAFILVGDPGLAAKSR